MDQVIKDRWVNALRSGEYKQAEGYLQTSSGFCCLGVLCDLAVKDGVIAPPSYSGTVYGYSSLNDPEDEVPYTEESVLPREVWQWAGLDLNNPHVRLGDDEGTVPISDPNDGGVSFHDIATLIEEQL